MRTIILIVGLWLTATVNAAGISLLTQDRSVTITGDDSPSYVFCESPPSSTPNCAIEFSDSAANADPFSAAVSGVMIDPYNFTEEGTAWVNQESTIAAQGLAVSMTASASHYDYELGYNLEASSVFDITFTVSGTTTFLVSGSRINQDKLGGSGSAESVLETVGGQELVLDWQLDDESLPGDVYWREESIETTLVLGPGDYHLSLLTSGYIFSGYDDSAGGYGNMEFAMSVVPVPASVWLFGSALAGLGWMRRRK
jgi:hypothetical protein